MKKTIRVVAPDGEQEKEITYIPVRFILAIVLIVLETLAVCLCEIKKQ